MFELQIFFFCLENLWLNVEHVIYVKMSTQLFLGFHKVKTSVRWWVRDWDSVHFSVKRFTFVIKSTGRHYRPTGLAETKVHPAFRLCHISSAHAESYCHQKKKYWHIFKCQYVRLHLFCSCNTTLTCDTCLQFLLSLTHHLFHGFRASHNLFRSNFMLYLAFGSCRYWQVALHKLVLNLKTLTIKNGEYLKRNKCPISLRVHTAVPVQRNQLLVGFYN